MYSLHIRVELARQPLHHRCDGRTADNRKSGVSIQRIRIVSRSRPFLDKITRQPNPVVQLWKAIVHLGGRHITPREEVELIPQIDEGAPLLCAYPLLPCLYLIDHACSTNAVKLDERKRIRAMLR